MSGLAFRAPLRAGVSGRDPGARRLEKGGVELFRSFGCDQRIGLGMPVFVVVIDLVRSRGQLFIDSDKLMRVVIERVGEGVAGTQERR